jgi:hypothetical protein
MPCNPVPLLSFAATNCRPDTGSKQPAAQTTHCGSMRTTWCMTEDERRRFAVQLIMLRGMDEDRDEMERAVDHVNPITSLTDSLIDLTVDALRELAQARGTTAEQCLMDLLAPRQ